MVTIILFFLLYTDEVSAPVPPKKADDIVYFPTTVGSKWVYDCDGEECIELITERNETKDGEVVVTISWETRPGKTTPVYKLLVSKAGVFRVENLGKKVDPPQPFLQLPIKDGLEWKWQAEKSDVIWVYKSQKAEEVKVPAGSFEAIPVHSEWGVNGQQAQKATDWFAPNVGIVKRSYGDKSLKILKSYTPGK